MTTGLAEVGAQTLRLKPRESSTLFCAPRTLYNRTAQSSARRYAHCEIPLASVKAIAAASNTKINDVVMTLIDDGLHRYLDEAGAGIDKPLVATMAMSLRDGANKDAGGNQAAVDLVSMGEPDATIVERLRQVHRSTTAVKTKGSKLAGSVRQLYSLIVFGASTLPDLSKAFDHFPNSNLVISNMAGPSEQLYLAGAPQVAFHGLPIVPPGCGLNVTFASVHKSICLAVGAAPEAVSDAERLIELIQEAFSKLQKATTGKPVARKRRAKKAAIKR
jgi:diacylglycerol O-acyltransferase / wax synthase